MTTKNFKRTILCISMLVATFVAASAQSKIDKYIERIEGLNDVTVTYSEKRTASRHKLYRVTKVVTFSNSNFYKHLTRAFEEERSKTVSAVMGEGVYTYKFVNGKVSSTYVLTAEPYPNPTKFTFVMNWQDKSVSDRDDQSSKDSKLNDLDVKFASLYDIFDLNLPLIIGNGVSILNDLNVELSSLPEFNSALKFSGEGPVIEFYNNKRESSAEE
ncbi:MAG: DUF5024 domain-containing protein [Muribaculaceae bacterium]|nr:DUF5024 domain-containing protein [Muribaculaceae bacterium]